MKNQQRSNLTHYKVGSKLRITKISGESDVHAGLVSMGILQGDEIEVISKALWGSPIAIKHSLHGSFALRRGYAENIMVEEMR